MPQPLSALTLLVGQQTGHPVCKSLLHGKPDITWSNLWKKVKAFNRNWKCHWAVAV